VSSFPPSPSQPPPWLPGPIAPPAAPPPPRPLPAYSRFSALVLSLFSAKLYRDVARNWRGVGLLYLLLLLALTWVPPIIHGHVGIRRFVRDEAPAIVNQTPTVTINKGVLSIAEPEPYFMRDPKTGKAAVYVDTTGAFDREKEAREAVILVSRSTVEVRQPNKTEVHDLSHIESFHMDKRDVARWLDAASSWFGPVAYASCLAWSLVTGLLRLLLYALAGMAFASSFNARLDFPALMRLSAVATTPAMFIDTLAWTFNFGYLPCCGWGLLMAVVTLMYVGFGVKANADSSPPPGPGYGFPPGPLQYPPPQSPVR
jgi:Protein of unknown function (DUF1189)